MHKRFGLANLVEKRKEAYKILLIAYFKTFGKTYLHNSTKWNFIKKINVALLTSSTFKTTHQFEDEETNTKKLLFINNTTKIVTA